MRQEIGYLVQIYSSERPKDNNSATIKKDLYFFTDKYKAYDFQEKNQKEDIVVEDEKSIYIRCTTFHNVKYYSNGSIGDEIYMINIEESDWQGKTSLERFYDNKDIAEEILFFLQKYDTGNCITENYYRHTEMISIPVNIEF